MFGSGAPLFFGGLSCFVDHFQGRGAGEEFETNARVDDDGDLVAVDVEPCHFGQCAEPFSVPGCGHLVGEVGHHEHSHVGADVALRVVDPQVVGPWLDASACEACEAGSHD